MVFKWITARFSWILIGSYWYESTAVGAMIAVMMMVLVWSLTVIGVGESDENKLTKNYLSVLGKRERRDEEHCLELLYIHSEAL